MHRKSIAPPESPSKLISSADGKEAVLPPQACCTSCWQLNLTRNADLDIMRLWPRAKSCLLLACIQCKSCEWFLFYFIFRLAVVVAVFAFPSVWEQSKRIIFCNTWRFCEIPISVSIDTTPLKYSHRRFCAVSVSFWTRNLKMFTIWCLAEEKIQGFLLLRNRSNTPWEMCEILKPRPDPGNDLECLI